MKWVFLSLILSIACIGTIDSINAENVPEWVKNTAGWWATDVISEKEFVNAIEYLLTEQIIHVTTTQTSENAENVPEWVKNTAGWWATDVISEKEFVNAIEYLANTGIIKIESKNSCESNILKHFDDNEEINNVCREHNVGNNEELIPYDIQLEFNEKGFRGANFNDEKKSGIYRIFMVGGSTMLGAETVNDVTIPSILQKILDSSEISTEIEVINVGISGSNTIMEYNLINSLVKYDPDLIIMYDGWNDLSNDPPVKNIIDNYRETCRIALENNFGLIMTLQPLPGFGNKILTEQEKINSLTSEDHNGFQILQAKSTYDYLERDLRKFTNLISQYDNCEMYDLRNIFDNISGPIYYDGGHTLQAGNMILAEKFFEVIIEKEFAPSFQVEKPFTEIISKYNSEPVLKYLLKKIEITNHGFDEELSNTSEMTGKKGKYFQLKHEHGDVSKILVGKDLRNMNLKNMSIEGYDLSGANLSGQDLREVDFSNIIIRGANLTYSNLEGVDLQGVDLIATDFSNANMKNVDFTDAIIGKYIQIQSNDICFDENDRIVNLAKKSACMIEVTKEEAIRTKFINTDLQNTKFGTNGDMNMLVTYADFSNSNLSNADISKTDFFASNFKNSILNNIKSNPDDNSYIIYSDFNKIKMKDGEFRKWWIQDVSFEDASITDSHFSVYVLVESSIKNTDFDRSTIEFYNIVGKNDLSCKNNTICTE